MRDQAKDTRIVHSRSDLIACILLVAGAVLLAWMFLLPHPHPGRGATQCKMNLFQLGKAAMHYEGSGHRKLSPENWETELRPFLEIDDDDEYAFQCPAREEGVRFGGEYSFAMNAKTPLFGEKDAGRVRIVESDHRLIEIDNTDGGETIVRGRPVARHFGIANALLYGGNVRSFELDEVMPDNAATLREFWLPESEGGEVRGKIRIVD